MDIWQGTGLWQGWRLTTDHAASCYGQPVLVDPDGKAYGPGDIRHHDYIGQKEIADMLGWSKQQVNNYYKDGRLPEKDQTIAGRPVWIRERIDSWNKQRLN